MGSSGGISLVKRTISKLQDPKIPSGLDEIRIGNAPCSWGTLEFGELTGQRLTFGDMLDELAEAGYVGSELGDWGFMPTSPPELAENFVERNLQLTGAYVGTPLEEPERLAANLEVTLRTARLLQQTALLIGQATVPHLVLAANNGTDPIRVGNAGRITPDMELNSEGWTHLAKACDEIAGTVREETGLPVVFHHHGAGYVETPAEVARVMDMTSDAVGLVFDTGHYALGAGRADTILNALDTYADRISYVHFKDWSKEAASEVRSSGLDYFESVRAGIFCELGQGEVDFPSVRDWLVTQDYKGFLTVEQDIIPGLGSPLESARRSRNYLDRIGFRQSSEIGDRS